MKFKRMRGIAAIVAGTLLLSGCMKIDSEMRISEDSTVSGYMISAYDSTNPFFAGGMDEMNEEGDFVDIDGAVITDYKEDKWVGKKTEFKNIPVSVIFEEVFEDDAALVKKDGKFFLTIENSELSDELNRADQETGMSEEDEMMKTMLESVEVTMTFEFPGKVISATDGVKVDGNRATLDMDSLMKDKIEIVAKAEGSGNGVLIGLALLALLVVGGVAVFALKKKGDDSNTGSDCEQVLDVGFSPADNAPQSDDTFIDNKENGGPTLPPLS